MKNRFGLYELSLPWVDASKWTKNKWYPLPVGLMCRETKNWRLDSYGVYKLEQDSDCDIESVIGGSLTLQQALQICEDYNGEKFEL